MNSDEMFKIVLEKQNTISEDISEIKVTLGKQEVSLAEHIKRSLQNEEALELTKKQFTDEIKPLKTHVTMVNGIIKFIGLISVFAGIAHALVVIVDYFRK